VRARPDRWLWGVVPAAALGFAVASHPAWRFQASLVPRVEAALKGASGAPGADGVSWAEITLSGRDAVVTGEAQSSEAHRAVLSALERTPGVRRVIDRTGAAVIAAPFTWSASRQGDRVILSGAVPRGSAKQDLADAAQSLLPGLPVEDRTSTARGEPARFADGAAFGLRLLARLDPGTVTIADGTLAVEGAAPTTDAFEATLASLREPPAGFRLRSAAILPPTAAPFTWSARRSGDAIAIAGHVPSPESRERVTATARRLDPASRVTLDLRVARASRPGLDHDAAIDLLLAQLARMGDGEVGLVDDVLRATGATPDKDGASGIAAALEGNLPAGFRLGDLRLSAVRPQPYRFQARRARGRLLLSGHLPDAAARDSVRSLVRRRFFVETVDDQLRLADGAPSGFAAGASAGLEQLSRLAEGEAALKETALVLSGEALYEQTAERMPADLRAALPPGFTAQANIRVRRDGGPREGGQP
jgi:osmotically-inducible protein OsmY